MLNLDLAFGILHYSNKKHRKEKYLISIIFFALFLINGGLAVNPLAYITLGYLASLGIAKMHKYLNANNALISSSRVLVILPTLSEGGAEKFITELLCEISKDSDKPEISLLVLSEPEEKRGKHLYDLLEHNNVNVHLFKRYKSRLLLILAYLRLLFKIKPNVILANLFLGEIFGVLSKLILFGNVKLIRRIANKKLNRTLIDKIFVTFLI